MWDRVTPADIEGAKEQLALHRAEIIARQANEVLALDADEAQVDQLAELVAAFVLKFKTPAPEATPAPASAVPPAKTEEPGGDRRTASLKVAGFDRVVLPAETRLTQGETAVSIDFDRSPKQTVY
jgi:hypothetical protein